jgi:hypothetical protein
MAGGVRQLSNLSTTGLTTVLRVLSASLHEFHRV